MYTKEPTWIWVVERLSHESGKWLPTSVTYKTRDTARERLRQMQEKKGPYRLTKYVFNEVSK
jgi:hypothetical protein